MKAIVYAQAGLPIDDAASLYEADAPRPTPRSRDLIVKIEAISVNPVDTKVRASAQPPGERILGWDAAGVVAQKGDDASLFEVGDRVWFAGDITRPGTYAEFTAVDERIVGHAPKTLSSAQAAALPLTTITAWELLFDRLAIPEGRGQGQTLLVVGAAGGVGSILVQLARQLTGVTIIGTASRAETKDWIHHLGAHHVVDHSQPLEPQLRALGVPQVDHVISLTHTDSHYSQLVDVLRPQGQFALIDDPVHLDPSLLKRKSISLHWEFMFTRSMYQTPDMVKQHDLLTRVAELIDHGTIKTTIGQHFGAINAENIRRAHALVESHKAVGKLVLEGF
ncbi:zinc-binding alcohol dehydrogenase family protein [Dyella jiangningensis]|uniref:zinc-binding alcohol dehydrogenase family protein n=1 Tax=Dyella sp. AtDHG13 TaxID=1938897 RepID=UPI000880A416|nr:zinc-binding alcohol dehydrogenase family protein [Dyella sp. AtDHG13]PXV56881.1 zinc-binding alcohol dehydrogenase family protein [Dyella sp. AtDHG13]SDK59476.1 zinc-binding alcohol dehydrogenase family protein [Dyella jiangningensis]